MALCRLLGGDDEQRSACDNEDVDVDVCGLGEVEPDTPGQIDDVLNVMKTIHDDTPAATTTVATTTTTSGLNLSAAADGAQSTSLMDSDVDFDGLLSTISDEQMACTPSAAAAVLVEPGAQCLLTPPELNDTDQRYMFYSSAHTDELIDTFLRSADEAETTAVYSELQAVQLSAEDWPAAEALNDTQVGGMLVGFDSSLLTIIELENDQTQACLTVTPGGCARQIANGETTTWNVFQGLEVSQFQEVGSEQNGVEEVAVDCSPPASEKAVGDDAAQTATTEEEVGDATNASEELTPGSETDATEVAGDDVPDDEVKTDDCELASDEAVAADADACSDDEYVLIVDCIDGAETEVEYEIIDETDKPETDSAAASPAAQREDELVTGNGDDADDVPTNS